MDTAYPIGTKVFVDDGLSEFEGTYLGETPNGHAKVRDNDTGDIMIGCIDFVEAA